MPKIIRQKYDSLANQFRALDGLFRLKRTPDKRAIYKDLPRTKFMGLQEKDKSSFVEEWTIKKDKKDPSSSYGQGDMVGALFNTSLLGHLQRKTMGVELIRLDENFDSAKPDKYLMHKPRYVITNDAILYCSMQRDPPVRPLPIIKGDFKQFKKKLGDPLTAKDIETITEYTGVDPRKLDGLPPGTTMQLEDFALAKMQDLQFSYYNDAGKLCGFQLQTSIVNPAVWTITVTEDLTNDPSERQVTLVCSDSLLYGMPEVTSAESLSGPPWEQIKAALGSESMAKFLTLNGDLLENDRCNITNVAKTIEDIRTYSLPAPKKTIEEEIEADSFVDPNPTDKRPPFVKPAGEIFFEQELAASKEALVNFQKTVSTEHDIKFATDAAQMLAVVEKQKSELPPGELGSAMDLIKALRITRETIEDIHDLEKTITNCNKIAAMADLSNSSSSENTLGSCFKNLGMTAGEAFFARELTASKVALDNFLQNASTAHDTKFATAAAQIIAFVETQKTELPPEDLESVLDLIKALRLTRVTIEDIHDPQKTATNFKKIAVMADLSNSPSWKKTIGNCLKNLGILALVCVGALAAVPTLGASAYLLKKYVFSNQEQSEPEIKTTEKDSLSTNKNFGNTMNLFKGAIKSYKSASEPKEKIDKQAAPEATTPKSP